MKITDEITDKTIYDSAFVYGLTEEEKEQVFDDIFHDDYLEWVNEEQ